MHKGCSFAVLLVSVKHWKLPKYSNIGDQLDKLLYHTQWNTIQLFKKNNKDLYELMQNDFLETLLSGKKQSTKEHIQNVKI